MAGLERDDESETEIHSFECRTDSWLPWAIAGVAIAVGLGLLIAFGGHRTSAPLGAGPGLAPPDPYAANLAIGDLKMSEASNFAGGKVTYLDGKVTNQGNRTLTGHYSPSGIPKRFEGDRPERDSAIESHPDPRALCGYPAGKRLAAETWGGARIPTDLRQHGARLEPGISRRSGWSRSPPQTSGK